MEISIFSVSAKYCIFDIPQFPPLLGFIVETRFSWGNDIGGNDIGGSWALEREVNDIASQQILVTRDLSLSLLKWYHMCWFLDCSSNLPGGAIFRTPTSYITTLSGKWR